MKPTSPQEQSPAVDCRKCAHATITVAEGGCIRCGYYNNTRISALLAKSPDYPCSAFTPAVLISPTVSADREGADRMKEEDFRWIDNPMAEFYLKDLPAFGRQYDLLRAEARRARSRESTLADELRWERDKNAVLADRNTTMHSEILNALAFLDRPEVTTALHGTGYVLQRQNLRDALSVEEARRARPDPKDAAILALANALILVRGTLNMLEHGRPFVTSAIASIDEAVRLPVVDKCLGDADLKAARPAVKDQNAAKWEHVWRCSGCGEMRPARDATGPRWTWVCGAWEHQCDASHREPARDFGPAVDDPRDALLRQCAEFFSSGAYKWTLEAATDRRIATAGLMLDEFNEVAAALRAAGVKPTPEAQEGKETT